MLEAIILSAVITGFFSLIGTSQAREQQQDEMFWSERQAQINRDFQRSERLDTQQFNVDMWNMYNDYNTPANQLKRGMQAGINPNAIINGLSTVSDHVVSSSPMNGSQAQFPGSIADGLLSLNPEIMSMFTNSLKTLSEKEGQDISNRYAPLINERMIKKADEEIGHIAAKKGFTDEQTRQAKELFPILYGKNSQELDNMQKQFDILVEEYSKAKSESTIADNEAAESTWKRSIREFLNVDPDSTPAQMIFQMIGSGPDGVEKAKTLMKFITTVGKQVLNEALDGTPAGFVVDKISQFVGPGSKSDHVLYTADGIPVVVNP